MGDNERRERSRTDERRSSEDGGRPNDNDDDLSLVGLAAGAVAAVAGGLLAWRGLSGMFSGNSGQSDSKKELTMGASHSSSGSGPSGAGQAGGGGRKGVQLWSTPPSGWIKVNTDGGCRDGSIAAGGLLRDEKGAWIKGFTCNIGCSNNVQEAELWGILKGLRLAWESGFKKVQVESDSSTAVDLVNSRVRVNRSLSHLITECENFINRKSWECVVTAVSREQNKAADHLAGLSFRYDEGYDDVLDSPPPSLEGILVQDKAHVAAASRAVPDYLSWVTRLE